MIAVNKAHIDPIMHSTSNEMDGDSQRSFRSSTIRHPPPSPVSRQSNRSTASSGDRPFYGIVGVVKLAISMFLFISVGMFHHHWLVDQYVVRMTTVEEGSLSSMQIDAPLPIRPYGVAYNASNGFEPVEELIHGMDMIQRHRNFFHLDSQEPMIFFITPTYYRYTQYADMTRLAQTLMHDKGVYWLVVEDAASPTVRIRNLLERTGLPFAHVAAKTRVPKDPSDKVKGRGVPQRNKALTIIESFNYTPGVVYFGDDDNAYDIRLMNQIRQTKRVAASGVGFSADLYERCLAGPDGKVTQLLTTWQSRRKFNIDMAAFCFTTQVLNEKQPRFSDRWGKGMQETNFVAQLVDDVSDLEALDQCQNIYAWHVRTSITTKKVRRMRSDPDYDLIKATI